MRRHTKEIQLSRRQVLQVWLTLAIIIAFCLFGIWFFTLRGKEAPVEIAGDSVEVSLASFGQKRLRLFRYMTAPSTQFDIFVKREDNGSVRVGFARCRRCYRFGVRRAADELVCGHCGTPMKFLREGQEPSPKADCTLLPLPFERRGDRLTLRAESVRAAFEKWYALVLNDQSQAKQADGLR